MQQLITNQFKQLFNQAIDQVVGAQGLSVDCILKYGSINHTLCNNCIFDPITQLSSNLYNGTGPSPFQDNQICPVCMGNGRKETTNQETVKLAIIFDSKYWLKINAPINVPDGSIQSICSIDLMNKIRAATDLTINTDAYNYSNYTYERAGDPELAGFGDTNYIMTMWKRK